MAPKKRDKYQREIDKQLIKELRAKGYSQTKIAEILNERVKTKEVSYSITQQMVSKDIEQIKEDFKNLNENNSNLIKNNDLFVLEVVMKEAFQEWEKGKKTKTNKRLSKKDISINDKNLKKIPASITNKTLNSEDKLSDPRFLQIIINCIRERNQLVGNYSTSPDDGDNGSIDNLIQALERSRKKIDNSKKDD